MQLSIIVAMSENRCIGKNNKLPWKLPDEWEYFKKVTSGRTFLMGRKSYQSPDGLYSDKRNIVVSSQTDLNLQPPDQQAHSLSEAFRLLEGESEVFVLGGVSIFEELLPKVEKLHISRIHAQIEGDVFFPEVDFTQWDLIYSDYHPADERHAYAFSMNQYVRKSEG
jgi:dihydrofolate reductase